jgi:hypothetical protein
MPTKLNYPNPLPRTEPEVFIIESLSIEDEIKNRFEGKALKDNLKITGQSPAYVYVRDAKSFEEAIELYRHSSYRFLHISAHGNPNGLATTLEVLSNQEVAKICQSKLRNRRVFFSSCEVGGGMLGVLMQGQNRGIHSIVAPIDKITFGVACAFWTALYIRAITINPLGMNANTLEPILTTLCNLFEVRLNWSYYSPTTDTWHQNQIG